VLRRSGKFVVRGGISDQSAVAIKMFVKARTDAAMVDHHGANRAAAFNKAQNLDVMGAAAEAFRASGLARTRYLGFIRLDSLSSTSHGTRLYRGHHLPNAMAEVPSGFHAAAKHPLKLAGRYAFLRSTKKVDRLKPKPQGQVAILEDRSLAHRKGRATAGVALAQADLHDAFGVLLARLRANAFQATDFLSRCSTMRADWTSRPQLAFNICKRGFFAEKPRIAKDGLSHWNLH